MSKSKGNEVMRIPRLAGVTARMMQIRKLEGEELELQSKALKDWVLYQWLLSKGSLCGVNYTQGELATYLNCTIEDIQIYMRDQVMNSRVWDTDNQQQLINGLLGNQLSWALEDRMLIQQEVQLLLNSQEGKYKPFISDAVLKALKLQLESSTSLQTLIRTMTGGTNVNFFTQINNNASQEEKGVSYGEALEIINETQKKLPDNDMLAASKYIEEAYDLKELPVVAAKEQSGIDIEKEGLNIGLEEIRLITDKNTTSIADVELLEIKKDKEHHIKRRQREYMESDEDIDPEVI